MAGIKHSKRTDAACYDAKTKLSALVSLMKASFLKNFADITTEFVRQEAWTMKMRAATLKAVSDVAANLKGLYGEGDFNKLSTGETRKKLLAVVETFGKYKGNV